MAADDESCDDKSMRVVSALGVTGVIGGIVDVALECAGVAGVKGVPEST